MVEHSSYVHTRSGKGDSLKLTVEHSMKKVVDRYEQETPLWHHNLKDDIEPQEGQSCCR
jgi:hypothetical protein